MGRLLGIDALRAGALLLMAFDHLLFFSFHPITHPLRVVGRLAEPLFAVIFGYFLDRPTLSLLRRAAHVGMAAFFSNLIMFPLLGRFDVLLSFLLTYPLFTLFRPIFPLFLFSFLLFPWDPTRAFLDYPLSIFLSQTALGLLLRRSSSLLGWGALMALPLYPYPLGLTLALTPVAALCLRLSKSLSPLSFLAWIGQHPLFFYVGHIYLLFSVMAGWLPP